MNDIDHHAKCSLSGLYERVFHINNAKNTIFQILARILFLNDIHCLLDPGFKLTLLGFF